MKTPRFMSLFLSISLAVQLWACGPGLPANSTAAPVNHDAWHQMLQAWVNQAGMVNYAAFKQNEAQLDAYLNMLASNAPAESWNRNEKLAYWINAYNAYTIKLILNHYPVESIRDIGSKIQVPFVNSPWDVKFIEIGGQTYDLNNIEHGIIRKYFNEPRIHFALVCAAVSCPKLLNEAYTAQKLETQLTKQTRAFLSNPAKNKIGANSVQLSKIFEWYKTDFTDKGSLIDYLNQYSDVKIAPNAKVSHLDYSWALNTQ